MSISQNDDLDNYVDTFRNVFLKQSSSKKNSQELLSLIEHLFKDLEVSRENEKCLTNNLKMFIDNEDITITTKYTLLQEKCSSIENDNTNIKVQIEELKREQEARDNEYLQKIKELEEDFKIEIANLQNNIKSDKLCFEIKERELNNEIQLAQAKAALQCDEIESDLKRQLVDVTSKLRQSLNSTQSLQLEMTNLRSQLQTQEKINNDLRNKLLYFKESPVNILENNLKNNQTIDNIGNLAENSINFGGHQVNNRPSSRQSEFSYTKLFESTLNNTFEDDYNCNVIKNAHICQGGSRSENSEKSVQMIDKPDQETYSQKKSFTSVTPLPIYFKSNIVSSKSDGYNRPVVYKGHTSKNKMVPPLMPCSTNNTTKRNNQRKRKLYDPDNFDYLNTLSSK